MMPFAMKRRNALTDAELKPGEYRQLKKGQSYGDQAWGAWRCPQCNRLSSIGRKIHAVNYTGHITPLSNCPHPGCGFSEDVTLEDWIPEAQGSA